MTRALASAEQAEGMVAEQERIGSAFDGNGRDHDPAVQDLDWEGFSAAYFPGSRRHDLRAITAYGAYKRSRVGFGQLLPEASQSRAAERIAMRARAVETWEDEGGASL
jgi:hypothetical protein